MNSSIIITGGAGFIGSHVIRLFVLKYPSYRIINFDKLTYAGNLTNLKDIESSSNYCFEHGDICDQQKVKELFEKYKPSGIIHLAAESHVDRSITDPLSFVSTNVVGTAVLLNVAKDYVKSANNKFRFYHISTDEVFGALGTHGFFTEETKYNPHSPYSASKASSDHFVRAYHDTYGLDVVLSNCSNNYGPNHFPEKLIPLAIHNIKNNKPIPVYGKGENVRDWLFVEDHAKAIDLIYHKGKSGETYAVGGHNEWKNIDLIRLLCKTMDKALNRENGASEKLITFVTDRAGHDLRYAIDASKIENELGWKPSVSFEQGLELTVNWFLTNGDWLNAVTNGEYMNYYKKQYLNR